MNFKLLGGGRLFSVIVLDQFACRKSKALGMVDRSKGPQWTGENFLRYVRMTISISVSYRVWIALYKLILIQPI